MKVTIFAALLFAAALVAPGTPAFAVEVLGIGTPDTGEFVKKAASSSQFEIISGELAIKRATTQPVRNFAQKMIADHSKADGDLRRAVTSSQTGIKVPVAPDEKQRKKIDELKAAAAEKFDQMYVDAQKDAHGDMVRLFKDYAEDGKDAALKTFASDTLPTLQQRQREVQDLDQTVANVKG